MKNEESKMKREEGRIQYLDKDEKVATCQLIYLLT